MRTKIVIQTTALGLLLCWVTPGWGETESQLLNQLGGEEAEVRAAAHDALVRKGPSTLPGLFERLGPANRTANIWAQRAIHNIVRQAARPGAEEAREQAESAMLAVLEGGYAPSKRRLAMESLRSVGGCRSVPVLRALFMNRNERQHARKALEKIPCPEATDALVDGIAESDEPEWKAALVSSLGAKRDLDGRKGVLRALRARDPRVRLAAIAAAAHLPHRQTQSAVTRIWKRSSEAERAAAVDALLQMAQTWSERGDTNRASRICKRIYKNAENPLWRCAGLAGIADTGSIGAVPVLIAALQDEDEEVRGVARDRLRFTPGEAVTEALVEALATAPTGTRADLIALIADHRDATAQESVPVLVQTMHEGDTREREAAQRALENIPGEETTGVLIERLKKAHPEMQSRLIRILGKRGDADAIPPIRDLTGSGALDVRVAAVEALGRFADPQSKPLLVAALKSGRQPLVDAAAAASVAVAAALEKLEKNADARELCKEAAKHAKNAEDLRKLAERLKALGAHEYVAEMGKRSGYIVHWWIAGPLPISQSEVEKELIDTSRPVDPSTPVAADNQTFPWKAVRLASPMGHISLERELARAGNVGAYLYAEISSECSQEVRLSIGSDDQFICYFNGEKVHEFMGGRTWTPDQDTVRVQLREGPNSILLKILNMGGGWGASLRVTDLEGHRAAVRQKTE